MTILILANSDVGLFKFRKELVEKLLENNKVILCLPRGKFIDYFVSIGCSLEPCEINRRGSNPFQDLKLYSHYKKIIQRNNPDIVFTYTIKPNVYGGMACARLSKRYVANITGLGTSLEQPGIMQFISMHLYKYGLRKAQKVFFQNTENRDFMLKHHMVKSKYDVLPGSGVNLEHYKLLDYPKNDTIDFFFIARIMKEKGIDQYLEAAEYIRNKYPQTRFHICGSCEQDYEERIRELQNKGAVIYHGSVNDMIPMYKIDSCTIHPTYYPEGMSNVLLESCASGRPIITTNRSGCREIVDDGVNGFICRQQDSTDLINKIELFLSFSYTKRKRLGVMGRQKVEREFDRTKVINVYMNEVKVSTHTKKER